MNIETFYDKATFTLTYVVWDSETKDALVIDPVMDYDPVGSKVSKTSYNLVKSFINEHQLNLHYVLETHAHADHLSASQLFKEDFKDVKIAISQGITRVQQVFKNVFDLQSLDVDGSQFDVLLDPGQQLQVGSIDVKALPTPGHTPACMSFLIEDAVFTGDALFIQDFGTGRCDFPDGDAAKLFDSITTQLYSLPDETRVFVGHDYQPGGRELIFQTTIGTQKAQNIQLKATTEREEFISFRENRDSGLSAPKLLFPSVQVNIDAGHLPKASPQGKQFLKIPINIDS